MKKKTRYKFVGAIFFILSVIIIYFSNILILPFPSQEENVKEKLEVGVLTKDFIVIQEITAQKKYLTGLDIFLTSSAVNRLTKATLMILDEKYNLLFRQNFTNESLNEPRYLLFKFPKKIHIGKGEKINLCLLSLEGDKDNFIGVPRHPSGKMGALYVRPVVSDDILDTFQSSNQAFLLKGSICVRTYESNYSILNWFKIFFLFLVALAALIIAYIEKVKLLIAKLKIIPERVYLSLALVFGLSLVFLTPPLQVFDEIDHFNRAYQLAELNVFQFDPTVPASFIELFDSYAKKMTFNSLRKTDIKELFSLKQLPLNPQERLKVFVPGFIFPYLPQALGISAGKMFNLPPVMLMYIGRIFNLLFSISLIYLAIRLTPALKWTMLLLGLMPMTLFLCASLSKDGMVISMAFLLIALFLRLAYEPNKIINKNNILVLFVVAFLVATTRPIYIILIGMYFLIPVHRIGSFRKYLFVFGGLIITVFIANQIEAIKTIFQPKILDATQSAANLISTMELYRDDLPNILPEGVNFKEQAYFILNNPIKYIGIMLNSLFFIARDFYLNTFVGIAGWHRYLPKWQINFYLLMLIMTALFISSKEITIGLKNKLIVASIFITGVILTETGMYLTWTPVGQDYIGGVQGRYFIPYAPLFFLLLYNPYFAKILSKQVPEPAKKSKQRQKESPDHLQAPRSDTIYNSIYLVIVSFVVISLLLAIYVVWTGYYIVLT